MVESEFFGLQWCNPVELYILNAYKKIQSLAGLNPRKNQILWSMELATSLIKKTPIIGELPTGNGKTLGNIIGALAASHELKDEDNNPMPIVIATSTTLLQDQVLSGDLNVLVKAGLINESDVDTLKGRSRYYCPLKAINYLTDKNNSQVDMFFQGTNTDEQKKKNIYLINQQWKAEASWNGDFDGYPGTLPYGWEETRSNNRDCISFKCDFYGKCPFFNNRMKIGGRKLIIANHDIVIADLVMKKNGGNPIIPFSNFILVFDEGHQLPAKGIAAGSGFLDFDSSSLRSDFYAMAQKIESNAKISSRTQFSEADNQKFDRFLMEYEKLSAACDFIAKDVGLQKSPDSFFLFKDGILSGEIKKISKNTLTLCELCYSDIKRITRNLRTLDIEKNDEFTRKIRELLSISTTIEKNFANLFKNLNCINEESTSKKPHYRLAKWIGRTATGLATLNSAPLEGAYTLKNLIWKNENIRAGLVSATITSANSFDRILIQLGLDEMHVKVRQFPSLFQYEKSFMKIVEMKFLPRQETKNEFLSELIDKLIANINIYEGTLILFNSSQAMTTVGNKLRQYYQSIGMDNILIQDEMPVSELIKTHKKTIDEGKGCITLGGASMSEGLDLPGKYCSNVHIATLPFTPPTSPTEQELKALLGMEHFTKRTIPDGVRKLEQMIGRLLRRESDIGNIYMYDNRLIKTQWGLEILKNLPDFQKIITNEKGFHPIRGLTTSETMEILQYEKQRQIAN